MTLRTGINWLDSGLHSISTAHIQTNNERIRHRLLARTVAHNLPREDILLLSFTEPRKGYWSFDLEQLVDECTMLAQTDDISDSLTIQRITTNGTPEGTDWDRLREQGYSLIIADSITNLNSPSTKEYSVLERTAGELEELGQETPTLVIDPLPPYRALNAFMDARIQLQMEERRLQKRVLRHPQRSLIGREEITIPSQKTLEKYAEAVP